MRSQSGPLLKRAGLVRGPQLTQALRRQESEGGSIVRHIIDLGLANENELCDFYEREYKIPRLSITDLDQASPETISTVSRELAIRFDVFPVGLDPHANLTLAMADPSDEYAASEVSRQTGRFVKRALAPFSAIKQALGRYYRRKETEELRPVDPFARPKTTPGTPGAHPPHLMPNPAPPPVRSPNATPPVARQRPFTPTPQPRAAARPFAPAPAAGLPAIAPPEAPAPILLTAVKRRGYPTPPPPSVSLPGSEFGGRPRTLSGFGAAVEAGEGESIPPPKTLDETIGRFAAAASRDSAVKDCLDFCVQHAKRVIFIAVRRETLMGWSAAGEPGLQERVRGLEIPLNAPSFLREALVQNRAHIGPFGSTMIDRLFVESLGIPVPPMVAIVPVITRARRPLGVLYLELPSTALSEGTLATLGRGLAGALNKFS